jgi:hypothetical protein
MTSGCGHSRSGSRPAEIGPGAVLAAVPDAFAFHAAAEQEVVGGEMLGPPVQLRVLLLAESSGDGDLRDL